MSDENSVASSQIICLGGWNKYMTHSIQEYSSADWNAESGVNTLNMSQHCPVMISNSKQ